MRLAITTRIVSLGVLVLVGGCGPKESAWERARAYHCHDVELAELEVTAELETMTKELSSLPVDVADADATRACLLVLDHFSNIAQRLEWVRGSAGSVTAARPDGSPAMIMDFGMSELRAARVGRSSSCSGGQGWVAKWMPEIATARAAITKRLAAAMSECAAAGVKPSAPAGTSPAP